MAVTASRGCILAQVQPSRADSRFHPNAFVVGANLPWVTYGCDFGANRWSPAGGVSVPAHRRRLREALHRLSDAGARLIRWFTFCDGRSGVIDDEDGAPGLDAVCLADLDTALAELDDAGLSVLFVLFDFQWFRPARRVRGVQLGGRASWLFDPRNRRRTLETVVAPFLTHAASHPAVLAWDIINEPEWILSGAMGDRFRRILRGMALRRRAREIAAAREQVRAFISDIRRLVHDLTPHPATVGLASAAGLPLVLDLDLDFHQVHWYDRLDRHGPLERHVGELALDLPVLLGEFPTRGSRHSVREILITARRAGYVGALAWSALGQDRASDSTSLMSGLQDLRLP